MHPSPSNVPVGRRRHGRGSSWADYLPLIVLVALAALAAVAKHAAYAEQTAAASPRMHDFMGFFLVEFSMFKFFDLPGFVDGFQMYDLLAKPFRPYGYLYPFIELSLGLGYLANWNPPVLYGVTLIVMVFSSLGVFAALRRHLDVDCACMGTVLKVPLSTIALTEDLSMAVMAAAMWMTR